MSDWVKYAKVGDKVAWAKNDLGGAPIQPHGVATIDRTAIYTIREIVGAVRRDGVFQVGLRFEEIHNPSVNSTLGVWEFDYDARCFRPVQPRNTDITIFTDMLNGTPADQPLENA